MPGQEQQKPDQANDPVDFTVKNEESAPGNPPDQEEELPDMAAFIASAAAAVRNVGAQFQVGRKTFDNSKREGEILLPATAWRILSAKQGSSRDLDLGNFLRGVCLGKVRAYFSFRWKSSR